MSNVKLFVILAAASLLVIFTIQNAAEIEVNLFFWSITTRRAFLVFGVLVIGILIGWIFHSISAHRKDQAAPRSGPTEPGAGSTMAVAQRCCRKDYGYAGRRGVYDGLRARIGGK
jgi:hypothetical protein